MKISYKDIDNWIGEILGDTCPKCNSIVWTDKTGVKWCDSAKCNWSNNLEFEKELIEFFKNP